MIRLAAVSLLLASVAAPALAQAKPENSKPQPVPFVDTVPAARDVPYPGTIGLEIDATNIRQGIFVAKETIPVAEAGHTVLLYPKWLPGKHAPRGEIEKLVDLVVRGNGKVIPWVRDTVDMFAFHLDVPAGVKTLDVSFKFASATQGNQGRIVTTPNMMSLQFNSMSLYPAGYFTRQIPIKATVTYPAGWTAATALRGKVSGSTYSYDTVDYDTLVDSPVLAGRYGKSWALSPRVNLNIYADKPEELNAKPEQIDAYKRAVAQSVKNFGAEHYDHYDFLQAITEDLGGIGLEHHRSTEISSPLGFFADWDSKSSSRNVITHEYTHSWDGKFRRGADLWTPDFRTPMRDSLLWVYEGQTQFWGYVLAARGGLVSKQDTLDQLAVIAASLDTAPGRQWRPLIDTTNDPIISARGAKGWVSNQRSEDYYNEGLLVWMEVDSLLRQMSGGKKSIDDFAKAFFGRTDGDWGVVTYTFDDVVSTLNGVHPYDWATLLKSRLYDVETGAPLGGFERNGYRLTYADQPTSAITAAEKSRKNNDFTYSIGLQAGTDGTVSSVVWNGVAYKQGLSIGDQIVAVGGQAYSGDAMKAALAAAKTSKAPVQLLVKSGTEVRTVSLDYHGGLRYPRFEKIGTGTGGLDQLLTAK